MNNEARRELRLEKIGVAYKNGRLSAGTAAAFQDIAHMEYHLLEVRDARSKGSQDLTHANLVEAAAHYDSARKRMLEEAIEEGNNPTGHMSIASVCTQVINKEMNGGESQVGVDYKGFNIPPHMRKMVEALRGMGFATF